MKVKVNLGCGKNAIEGWINIDNSPKVILSKYPLLRWILFKLKIISKEVYEDIWSRNIIWHDVRKGLPFENESVDVVYCSHLLEHLTRDEAKELCLEVFRVLKPKGIFRVVVPDLKKAIEAYLNRDFSFFGIFDVPIAEAFMRYNMFQDFHKWAYDFESLSHMLKDCGFYEIHECSYRVGRCPDLEKIELRGRPERSLYVEAVK